MAAHLVEFNEQVGLLSLGLCFCHVFSTHSIRNPRMTANAAQRRPRVCTLHIAQRSLARIHRPASLSVCRSSVGVIARMVDRG